MHTPYLYCTWITGNDVSRKSRTSYGSRSLESTLQVYTPSTRSTGYSRLDMLTRVFRQIPAWEDDQIDDRNNVYNGQHQADQRSFLDRNVATYSSRSSSSGPSHHSSGHQFERCLAWWRCFHNERKRVGENDAYVLGVGGGVNTSQGGRRRMARHGIVFLHLLALVVARSLVA